MDIMELLQKFNVKIFYYALHNAQYPNRSSLQGYIQAQNVQSFFPIAYEHRHQKYWFFLFNDVNEFIRLYSDVDYTQRRFYCMYLFMPRNFYMDLDLETNVYRSKHELKHIASRFIKWLSDLLNSENMAWNFEKVKPIDCSEFIVFDSSRWLSCGKRFKISLHILSDCLVWSDIGRMKSDIQKIKVYGTNERLAGGIDLSVYKKLQLLRQSESHKFGDISSTKKVLFGIPKESLFVNKVQINQVDNIDGKPRHWVPHLNSQSHARLKIIALREHTAVECKRIQCNDIYLTNDNCFMCAASENYVIRFDFESNINGLTWTELRCANKKCYWKIYAATNSTIKYPRTVANLPLQIQEIEELYLALEIFQLQIHDPYGYIFSDWTIKQTSDQTTLRFTKYTNNITARCGHQPEQLICKKPSHKYFKQNGPYSIQCNCCYRKFTNISALSSVFN